MSPLTNTRVAQTPRWVKDSLWRRARAVPSLDLRFADNKSLVDATTGQNLVTFSRASGGTYTDSQGVIRNAVTNLLLRSEEFQTTWSSLNVTVSTDTTTSPTGSSGADAITPAASTAAHLISQAATVQASTPYIASVYVKSDGAPFVQVVYDNGSSVGAFINANLSTGAITRGPDLAGGATSAAGSVVSVGNGWYRISVGATHTGTIGRILISPLPAGSSTASINPTTTTAATDKVILWGAQLEQSSTVGEYIPTTSSINSAPRFDHNPTTGESLGLLVEESRANLLLRSEEFETTWVPGGVTPLANTTTSPSGSTTADTLTVTAGVSNANLYQVVSCNASTVYTLSVYIRLGTLPASDYRLAVRDDSNGAFIAVDIAPSVSLSTSSWQRVTYTFTTPAGCVLVRPYVYRYTSASGGTFFAWGAQLEQGSFPTSYIPTTTSAVTRAADVASISGSNYSSWASALGGVGYCEFRAPITASATSAFSFNDSTANNRVTQLINSFSFLAARNTAGAGTLFTPTTSNAPATGFNKSALAFANSDVAVCGNGGTVATVSDYNVPTLTQLQIGNQLSAGYLNGTIRRLAYWGQRLPNSVLQRITQ